MTKMNVYFWKLTTWTWKVDLYWILKSICWFFWQLEATFFFTQKLPFFYGLWVSQGILKKMNMFNRSSIPISYPPYQTNRNITSNMNFEISSTASLGRFFKVLLSLNPKEYFLIKKLLKGESQGNTQSLKVWK